MIDCPTSYGELIDKITILEIKKSFIQDGDKLANVTKELDILNQKLSSLTIDDDIAKLKNDLYDINLKLWKVEDDLRDCERLKSFDDRFVELARAVYFTNDLRSTVKKKINTTMNSNIVEEKSYTDYSMRKVKITVLLSIYEAGEWIKNRLDNLMSLTNLNDCEIWCVNANSPDPRDHEIPLTYKDIKYVKLNKRLSLYSTWNYIIKNSSSDYIVNANADDIIAPDCYAILASVLDNNSDVGFAYPSWYTTDLPNQSWSSLTSVDPSGHPGHFCGDLDKSGVGHFPMWRRSLHTELGYFDEEFKAAADADWWNRCYHVGKVKFYWVQRLLACYLFRHGQNLWHKYITSEEWNRLHTKNADYRNGNRKS